jgi:hypothetical protein
VISIDAASFSCETLFEALTREKCESCGRFGGYLYLITCKRVCYLCFTSRKEYLPVVLNQTSLTLAMWQTKRRKKTFGHLPARFCLPVVRSLRGRYTARAKHCKCRMALFDREALKALVNLPEDTELLNRTIETIDFHKNDP